MGRGKLASQGVLVSLTYSKGVNPLQYKFPQRLKMNYRNDDRPKDYHVSFLKYITLKRKLMFGLNNLFFDIHTRNDVGYGWDVETKELPNANSQK